ncbi:MAG TPA: zinc-binding dehydrogenase [Phycisphaerae bacterium]|nr:zinc-binding dehydrogenase [Phycisphaerae bacterium]HRY71122.1 zinc-binding dehydrogenase [Phycisphaerae bacterium]HSA29468.1 zinc-binding dehydrogenase [Phycisphaerae bacterium]
MSWADSPGEMIALVYRVRPVAWTVTKVAGWVWPGVFWSGHSGLRLARVPIPPLPSPRWVRLRPLLGGICGTDLAAVMQRHHPASILQTISSMPAVLGHENVSIIDEIGPEVTGWQPGDRVVAESALSCAVREIEPRCGMCAAGRFTLCQHFRTGPLPVGSMIGWNNFTGGSWAPRFVAHVSQLHRVPAAIDDATAVLTDPIAGAVHAVLRCLPSDQQTVLVFGSGLVGMGVTGAIRALGSRCRVVALGRSPRQAEMMRRFGANEQVSLRRSAPQAERYGRVAELIGGEVVPSKFGHQAFFGGFDIVFDCVGNGQSLTDAMKYARSGGTVVEVGTSQIGLVDTAPLWLDELSLIGSNGRAIERYQGRPMHTYEVVFELITQKKLDLTGLLTHRFRVDQYREAFAALAGRARTGAIKVAFAQDHADPHA